MTGTGRVRYPGPNQTQRQLTTTTMATKMDDFKEFALKVAQRFVTSSLPGLCGVMEQGDYVCRIKREGFDEYRFFFSQGEGDRRLGPECVGPAYRPWDRACDLRLNPTLKRCTFSTCWMDDESIRMMVAMLRAFKAAGVLTDRHNMVWRWTFDPMVPGKDMTWKQITIKEFRQRKEELYAY